MDLAADESVILAYWQLRDGVADHDTPRRHEIPRRLRGAAAALTEKAAPALPGI